MPLRRSQRVWAGQLVPEMEAIYGGGLIFRKRPLMTKARCRAGFRVKRLKGFEPSTFCMAIRPDFEAPATDVPALQGFRNGAAEGPNQRYARIRSDMRRFGHSCG
jgi:hypothetical protein